MTPLEWAQERLANTERIMWLKQTVEDRASWAEDRDYWQQIVDALTTADTARAQAFEEAAKEVDVLIAQERERLRSAYTLPYDVPAQRIRSATITAYTVVVDLLRARATAGDTP